MSKLNYRKKDPNLYESVDLYKKIMRETHYIIQTSFENQFTDAQGFECIVLMVVSFRNGVLNQSDLGHILDIMDVSEDNLLETIQILFEIHNEEIPADFLNVIERLSALLPEITQDISLDMNDGILSDKEIFEKILDKVAIDAKTENHSKKIQTIEHAIQKDPYNKNLWFLLGLAYLNTNMLAKAKWSFLNMRKIDPEDKDANYFLGIIFVVRNNYLMALKYATKAHQIEPQNREICLLLSLINSMKGNVEESISSFSKYIHTFKLEYK